MMINGKQKWNKAFKDFWDFSYSKANIWLLILFSFLIICNASMGTLSYNEIDSNALPVISLQYRGSVLMEQQDIDQARTDFPFLYDGIYTYDDLRSSKLIKVTDETWLSYYFPIYPLFCIPVKVAFSIMGLPQERTFSVTNAMLVIFALYVVLRYLKVTDRQKLFLLLLLMINPVIFYINYICYEAFMFSMVTVSLVLYYNKCKKRSAFLLSLAGMSNSAVMAIGLLMVAEYVIEMFAANRGRTWGNLVKNNLKETVLYAISFIPCFAQYIAIYTSLGTVERGTHMMATTGYYGARFLTYLFDPTVGFFTFAPLQILFFIYCILVIIRLKKWKALVRGMFLVAAVAAFSLVVHINCGMIFCARYLVWTYPACALFIAEELDEIVLRKHILTISKFLMVGATCFLILINYQKNQSDRSYYFNNATQMILNICPGIYNPYSATFYCRTLHTDGAYHISEPAYYRDADRSLEVRKIIFKAVPESEQILLNDLTGSDESINYLRCAINKYNLDGKFHYINLPRNGKYSLKEKLAELELGHEIYFDGTEEDAHKYFVYGISATETNFAWTDGNKVVFRAYLPDYNTKDDLRLNINIGWVFYQPQRIIIKCDEDILAEEVVETGKTIEVNIPKQYVGEKVVELSFELPDAVSPKYLRQSTDSRTLGLAVQSFSVSSGMDE